MKNILLFVLRILFRVIGPKYRTSIIELSLERSDDTGEEIEFLKNLTAVKSKIISDYKLSIPGYEFLNRSFSQNGEDLILSRLLEKHPIGKYIDIGAHHPYRFSNTANLNIAGWKGLNVDSSEASIKIFEDFRKCDENLCIALGKTEELRTYFEFQESALNTFAEDRVLELQRSSIYPKNVHPIKVVRAKDFLEAKYTSDTYIFTLDVEGLDLEIITDLDFNAFKPCFLIIEMNFESLEDVIELKSKIEFLNHYKVISVAFNSVIFKSKGCEHADSEVYCEAD